MAIPAKERMKSYRQRKAVSNFCEVHDLDDPCFVFDFMEAKQKEVEELLCVEIERFNYDFNRKFFKAITGKEARWVDTANDTRMPIYPVIALTKIWHDLIPEFPKSHNIYNKGSN